MQKRAFVSAALLAFSLAAAVADTFTAPRPLFTLKTEHFTIIFPKESRAAAEYLAREAEGIYDDVAAALKAPKDLHLPVVITPDSDDLNGYCSIDPYTHIVLYQAPISPNDGFVVYQDDLRKLFMHELTHAVSLNMRDPFWGFLAALFTNAIAPASFLSPASLVEGVTVSMESRDGFGRAAETDYLGKVRQDIIEGRFKSFPEAAGLWQGYPGGIHYVYGGLFSRYLQETYGMDAYDALWKNLSKGDFIAGLEGWLCFKGAFEKAYGGLSLDAAWKGFRDWASLKRPVVTAVKPLSEKFEVIGASCADASRFYWSESTAVMAYDPGTGRTLKVFDSDGQPNRLSVSPDGERLLVSTFRFVDSMPKALLRVWNLKKRRWETSSFPNRLREAAWLPDGKGILACRLDGYTMDLVRVDSGGTEVLLRGTERLVPSAPCPFGENGIAFLLKVDGVVRLARMDLSTRSIRLLDAGKSLSSARYLSAGPAGLCFSYDVDGSLFKLGRYGDAGLSLQGAPVSGGVRYPAARGGEVYYVGSFSQGDKPLRFPADNPDLRLEGVESAWVDFDPAGSGPSAYDAPPSMAAKPYDPLPWLLVPHCRYPFLTTNETGFDAESWRTYVNGAGVFGSSVDPLDEQSLSWSVAYKWLDRFAQAELSYSSSVLPFDFSVSAYDRLGVSGWDRTAGAWAMARRIGISVSADETFVLLPANRAAGWRIYGAAAYLAPGPGGELGIAQSSPYGWPFSAAVLPFGGQLAYSDRIAPALDENAARGVYLSAGYHGYLEPFDFGWPKGYVSGEADLYAPYLGAQLQVQGALRACPGLVFGPSGPEFPGGGAYLAGGQYPSYGEYQSSDAGLGPFIVYGDASVGYRLRLNSRIDLTEAYLKRLNLRGGYRACYSGEEFLHSAYARATIDGAWSRGPFLGSQASLGCEIDVLFSRQDGPGDVSLMLRPILSFSM